MHSCVYVIIGNKGDIPTLVAKTLSPFDGKRQVRPYKLHLSASTITAMAKHYGLSETDLKALAKKLPDWMGAPGGVDWLGLYARMTENSDGKWDWYEIGGRWNGSIRGRHPPRPYVSSVPVELNTTVASDLLAARNFVGRLPFAIVTPLGEWIERSTVVTDSRGMYLREESPALWRKRVARILRTFARHRVVCVDAHC